MDIRRILQEQELQEARIACEQVEQSRCARSARNMLTHRPRGQRQISQIYGLSTIEFLRATLPPCEDAQYMLQALAEEEMFLATETILRSNRELIEFHNMDNQCPRCEKQLTSCHCRDLTRLDTPRLLTELHIVLKKLYCVGLLSIVQVRENGTLHISNARNKRAPRFFPAYGMGTGFSVYAKDYHLRPPD